MNLDQEEEELLATEMVKRRVVDEVRVFSQAAGTPLLTVTRKDGAVVASRHRDQWVEDSRDRLRGADLTHDEWDQYFSDTHILVPNLRVEHYRLKLPPEARVCRGRWGDDFVHLRRLDDTVTRLVLGLPIMNRLPESLSPEEGALRAVIELAIDCKRLGIVAGISP
jgi:hypothetical protein